MEKPYSSFQDTCDEQEARTDAVAPPLAVIPAPPATASAPLQGAQFSRSEREAIYEDFQPLVRRLIRQYGDTPEIREDLKGEIYCRFCDLLEAFDPSRGVNLYAYLVRMLSTSTYAYARSLWRRRQRKEQLEVSWEDQEEQGLQVSDAWEDPIEKQIQADDKEAMLEALRDRIGNLTERQRQVVVWRYYEAHSFEEIASRLNIKPATARSILRHAINNLRQHLAQL
jgi:RNA polymerase sigma factor (sigma-70 family)